MRIKQWHRSGRVLLGVTALLSCVGCAATPTNPFNRLLNHVVAGPNEQRPALVVAHADGSAASGRVTSANYVTDVGRKQRTNCQTGDG